MQQWVRSAPERIVLGVRPGVEPNGNPPVRIFLGSQASQFRPERVLAWSVEQVRDPARVYEIHLMKEIAGFDRSRWTTGFTNYRFAIPEWAGRSGRAIYNDEDEIYLSDPALLFDAEMGGAGFLAIAERESSVMLIDCAKMAPLWNVETARRRGKKALLRSAVATPGLFGRCDPHWNARDGEYREGRTHCLHYTTLHTQPWRPFPERFVYDDHPLGHLWFDLERSADAAGFQLFARERTSAAYAALARERAAGGAPALPAPEGRYDDEWAALARRSGAEGVVRYAPFAAPPAARADGAVACAGLEGVPEDDLAWVLDELFAAARRFVFVAVAPPAPPADRFAPTVFAPAARWPEHLAWASRRHPDRHWQLVVEEPGGRVARHWGGRFAGEGPPRVWILEDGAPDAQAAARAVALQLGWPHEARRASALEGPWPDLALASGAGGAEALRALRERADGRTRLVLVGEEAAARAEDFDLAVTPSSAGFTPHPKRLETAGPLVAPAAPERRAAASEAWRKRVEAARAPRVALLAAGPGLALSRREARALARDARRLAGEAGGSLFVLVGAAAAGGDALAAALAGGAELERGEAGGEVWLALLALADAFVVPGGDELALAEACATGRPVSIHPAGSAPRGAREAARRLVARLARAPRANDRGTIRPQQGLEHFCSRLLAEGRVRPPRDRARLHAELERRGAAHRLGSPEPAGGYRPLRELDRVAGRVRELLGVPPAQSPPAPPSRR